MYKDMSKVIEKMANDSYEDFVKALVSFEIGVDDEKILEMVYERYIEDDEMGLISERIEELVGEKY